MSKVLMINGSPHKAGCTHTALAEVAGALARHGVEVEEHWVGTKPVVGCIACRRCKTTGRCVFDDEVNVLNARAGEFDAMVVGAPVYFAGPAGQACAFLDRLFYASCGAWQGKPGCAVVSCRRGGASASFDRLNKYFTISNMPVVSSQYWNSVHGNTPDEVRQDLEGLQVMRTLGDNLAHLLACLEAGRAAGVPAPEREPRVSTNFIR